MNPQQALLTAAVKTTGMRSADIKNLPKIRHGIISK
jgi:hypothetical protein